MVNKIIIKSGLVCCFTDDVNEVLGGYNDGFVRAFDL